MKTAGAVEIFPCDVTDDKSVAAMAAAVKKRFGRVDVLINNAGVFEGAPLLEMSVAQFDRVLVQPLLAGARADRRGAWTRPARPVRSRPVFAAVRTFTLLTLRRSVLHQGILVALSAAGAGLVTNSLIGAGVAGWFAGDARASRALLTSVVWAPFALIYVASLAISSRGCRDRSARVFRITESDAARAQGPDAPSRPCAPRAVVPLLPAAPLRGAAGPKHWRIGGRAAVRWLLVEIMRHWARIPFTCSYIPERLRAAEHPDRILVLRPLHHRRLGAGVVHRHRTPGDVRAGRDRACGRARVAAAPADRVARHAARLRGSAAG
jgi:NAD(P)-dependent dehydrogenase (short-subunit alcohol dehydrogenase family)